jgi:membrane associated rhomboid family serine protease
MARVARKPKVSDMIEEALTGIALFIGTIWCVFIISRFIPGLNRYGVVPRTWTGLAGIPVMPFLHKDLTHILGNSIPLLTLLVLLDGSSARPWQVVVGIILLGGFLLWFVGRPQVHIGASGLVFGLIAFLVVSGFQERRLVSFGIAILVGFIYGGTLVSGVLPRLKSCVSWEGHLCSALAGGIVAYALTS